MGLGGFLKKVGLPIAAAAAAPFTGGASLSILPAILGAGGAAVGSMANAAAQNRGAAFGGQLDLATLLAQRDMGLQQLRAGADNDYTSNQIARENSGMATQNNAWANLLKAQRVLNPVAMPNVSPYQSAQRQATDAEKQGANALTAEVMARLQGGNPVAAIEKRDPKFDYDPMKTIDPRLLKPGTGEKIGGILAPILASIGAIGGRDDEEDTPRYSGNGRPVGPQMTPTDLAFLRTRNPRLGVYT